MNINQAYKLYKDNLEVLEPKLGQELATAVNTILDFSLERSQKLAEEVFSLQLEVEVSDKLAIEKMQETESYKELYELCAAHIGELQHKLDLCELAEAKARINEEKYTAVALHDTFNEFKMQRKINQLGNALSFYSHKTSYKNIDSLVMQDKGEIARKTLEVITNEKN